MYIKCSLAGQPYFSYVHACAYDKWAGEIRAQPPPTTNQRPDYSRIKSLTGNMNGNIETRSHLVSQARPSLSERGSGLRD